MIGLSARITSPMAQTLPLGDARPEAVFSKRHWRQQVLSETGWKQQV